MKNIIIILTLGLIFSCNNPKGEQTQTNTKESYYGDLINTSEIINISEVKNSISQKNDKKSILVDKLSLNGSSYFYLYVC